MSKKIESKNPKVVRTKNRRIMLLSEISLKKILKEKEARGLLSSSGITTPLS